MQIWSVKKNEEAANKKKPKMSAAQLRVQKGTPMSAGGFLPSPGRLDMPPAASSLDYWHGPCVGPDDVWLTLQT